MTQFTVQRQKTSEKKGILENRNNTSTERNKESKRHLEGFTRIGDHWYHIGYEACVGGITAVLW